MAVAQHDALDIHVQSLFLQLENNPGSFAKDELTRQTIERVLLDNGYSMRTDIRSYSYKRPIHPEHFWSGGRPFFTREINPDDQDPAITTVPVQVITPHDPVTGLLNNYAFIEFSAEEVTNGEFYAFQRRYDANFEEPKHITGSFVFKLMAAGAVSLGAAAGGVAGIVANMPDQPLWAQFAAGLGGITSLITPIAVFVDILPSYHGSNEEL